jgi:mRNA interferase RelE/StbE
MPDPVVWKIVVHRRAEKVLYRLSKENFKRIRMAIRDLAQNPRSTGSKKLSGFDNLYRVRVGNWRISYAIEADQLIILILEISPRGGAYRKLK